MRSRGNDVHWKPAESPDRYGVEWLCMLLSPRAMVGRGP